MDGMSITLRRTSATAEIARVGGHYAVQGHSRSVSIETRMRLSISGLTGVLSQLSRIIDHIIAFVKECIYLTHSFSTNIAISHM